MAEASRILRPEHLGAGLQVQQVATGEIDEQQAATGFEQQVSEGVEHEIAGVVGHPQPAVATQAHESGRAATVGDVDATAVRVMVVTGDEAGIGRTHQMQPGRVRAFALQQGAGFARRL